MERADAAAGVATAEAPRAADAILGPGVSLGRFVILGLLGRGGMGEVYSAYDPELDRKVAIKLVRADRSGDADKTRARLIREARATAKVSHRNVVVVYDVGAVGDRVFIAMQFIDGYTLRYWVHSQNRAWSEIAAMFVFAGRGLAAAHEQGLVHRDFKPDNVMVDSAGNVRVTDFGLARQVSLGPGAGDAGAARLASRVESPPAEIDATPQIRGALPPGAPGRVTGNGPTGTATATRALGGSAEHSSAFKGTPAYMSPEQFLGNPADARSDQFSFCVALWEAAYGARPFAGETYMQLAASVVEGRLPAVPSSRHVPRWGEKVLERGLSVDPADRFPSMTALLAELDRLPSAGRTGFVKGAAAKLADVWRAPVDGQSIDSPEKATIRRAFLETGKPYAASAFAGASAALDKYTKRWTELYVDACEATHVRGEQSPEVLDLRMQCLFEGLENLRALCRLFSAATGDVVENAVSAALSLGMLERCENIELLRAVVRPPDDADKRAAVAALRVQLAEVRALWRVGRYKDGLEAAAPVVDKARRIGYAPALAETLLAQGLLQVENFDASDRVIPTLEEALWTAEESRHDEVVAETATYLVHLIGYVKARFDVAEIWCRHAEAVLRRMGGHEILWAWYHHNRGNARKAQGRLGEAVDDFRLAIAIKERVLGPDDPDVGISLDAVADIHVSMGDHAQGLAVSERALRILSAGFGPDHPRTAYALANRGEFLCRSGRFAEARELATRALGIIERETDPGGVLVTYPLLTIGLTLLGTREPEQAIPLLERAAAIREAAGTAPALLGKVHFALARALYDGRGQHAAGRQLAQRARSEYERAPITAASECDRLELERWLTEHL